MPLKVLQVPSWSENEWLTHGFSTRPGGNTTAYHRADLNLGFTDHDDRQIVANNRALFFKAATGTSSFAGVVTLRQIHSSLIHRVGAAAMQPNDQPAVSEGDGLMTDEPGVLLGIQTADCLPILIVDPKQRAVAAFHAGWRGTLARIVENGVDRMRLEFGSDPENLIAAVGPGIGQCCYTVGEEVRTQFESQFSYAPDLLREATHLNLAEANRRQLLAAGLKESAIHLTGHCTGCDTDLFFSHRNERGYTGRMMSVIGVTGQQS